MMKEPSARLIGKPLLQYQHAALGRTSAGLRRASGSAADRWSPGNSARSSPGIPLRLLASVGLPRLAMSCCDTSATPPGRAFEVACARCLLAGRSGSPVRRSMSTRAKPKTAAQRVAQAARLVSTTIGSSTMVEPGVADCAKQGSLATASNRTTAVERKDIRSAPGETHTPTGLSRSTTTIRGRDRSHLRNRKRVNSNALSRKLPRYLGRRGDGTAWRPRSSRRRRQPPPGSRSARWCRRCRRPARRATGR